MKIVRALPRLDIVVGLVVGIADGDSITTFNIRAKQNARYFLRNSLFHSGSHFSLSSSTVTGSIMM